MDGFEWDLEKEAWNIREQISIRLDCDVLEHFRRYPRYQTRINAILRAVMEHEKKSG